MVRILVTGANGLVGRALCSVLDQTEHQVVRAVRTSTTPWEVSVGNLNKNTGWSEALGQNTNVVVHLAGQVPSTDGAVGLPGDRYAEVNTLGTANLARQCAQNGVKRFIFVSTVKVLGEGKSEPYRETDLAVPADAYAISKRDAEQALWQVAAETGMKVVMLRPPLVYGPGTKGNFLRLMQTIDKGGLCRLGTFKTSAA
jgi:nucleoside-diphosphate-sugar epimerase